MTVGIIGAGPAGCFLGSKLSWDKSIIFERKNDIGYPIQCTGIVTESIMDVLDEIPDSLIKNYIDTFRIISPDGNSIDITLKKKDIILHRADFDKYMSTLAVKAGTPIKTNYALQGWKKKDKTRLFFTNGKYEDVDYLVGADGPHSKVAQTAGLSVNRKILTGYQARVKANIDEPNVTQVHFGLGEFAWVVPENKNFARVGIIGRDVKSIKKQYDGLLSKYTFIEDQSGPIPLYDRKQIMQKDNIALIGDAATQVKATTYGGIIYGFIAGKMIAEKWDGYEKRFRKHLGKELWISLKLRNILNKLSPDDCNDLIKTLAKPKNRQVLESEDRNYPSRIVPKLLLKEMDFWKYGLKVLKPKLF